MISWRQINQVLSLFLQQDGSNCFKVILGSIWYHSEHSDVSYSPNQFLGWDFFCCFLQQDGSNCFKVIPWKSFKKIIITHCDKLKTDKSSVVFILVMLLCILLWSSFSLDICTPKSSGFQTIFFYNIYWCFLYEIEL